MRRPWHAGAALLDEEERLANLISDRISPRLVAELEILPCGCTPARAAPITCRFHGKVDRSCEFPLLWPRSSLAHFCIVMNASCADPPKLQQRWALSREIHSGAVLLPPLTRSKSAS